MISDNKVAILLLHITLPAAEKVTFTIIIYKRKHYRRELNKFRSSPWFEINILVRYMPPDSPYKHLCLHFYCVLFIKAMHKQI